MLITLIDYNIYFSNANKILKNNQVAKYLKRKSFICLKKVQPKHLACISIGCLHIAAKVLEDLCDVSSTHELIRISQCKFTVSDLSRMEKIISEKLNFQFQAVTALTFLHLYHAIVLSHTSSR